MDRSRPDQCSPISRGVVQGFYPAPLAHAFYRATNADERDRDLCYEHLHGSILRWAALVALLAAMCTKESADAAQRILQSGRLKTLSGGEWLRLLREACATLSAEQRALILGSHAADAATFTKSSLYAVLGSLVELRNEVEKQGRLELRGEWRAQVHRALELMAELRFQSILVPRSVEDRNGELLTYRIAVYRGMEVRHPVRVETRAELELGRAHLHREGHAEILPLHPFLTEGDAAHGGPLRELYWLGDLHDATFRSIVTGRDLADPARDALERQLTDLSEGFARSSRWIVASDFRCPDMGLVSTRKLGAGDLVGRRYEVVRHVGSGAFADVYEARDLENAGAAVALKMLPLELAREPETLARFRFEVKALRAISHPHLVRYIDHGDDDGDLFLVTELAHGWQHAAGIVRDLAAYLEAERTAGRAGLDEPTVRAIALDLAQGLAAVHAQNLVHRDVKPANVYLFEESGVRRVKLGDLGIARRRGGAGLTLTGFPLGTPEYMAPEQPDADDVDARMDVYAFGVVLYELLAGEPPFRGRTPERTRELHRRRLAPIQQHAPDVSDKIARLIAACLSKDPRKRPRHGVDLYERLSRLDDDPVESLDAVDIEPERRLGHYTIGSVLEKIPGAAIFRAVDDRDGKPARVGILSDTVEGDRAQREAALQKLSILHAVSSERLARVREYGDEDGYTWVLLDDVPAARWGSLEVLRARDILAIGRDLALGLGVLHAYGLRHGRIETGACIAQSTSGERASAVLDVPALLPTSDRSEHDESRELVRLICDALSNAVTASGHERRAVARARKRIGAALRAETPSARAVAQACADSLADLAELRVSRRAWRVAKEHPVVASLTAACLLAGTGAPLSAHFIERREAEIERRAVERMELEINGFVDVKRVREAQALLESHPELVRSDAQLAAWSFFVPVLVWSENGGPLPPIQSIAPLAEALSHVENLGVTAPVEKHSDEFLKWCTAILTEPLGPPEEYAHAFWRVTSRVIGEKLGAADAITTEKLKQFFSRFESCERPNDACARLYFDNVLAFETGFYLPWRGSEDERPFLPRLDAEKALQLAQKGRELDRWNHYDFECYVALASFELSSSDPARASQARQGLDEVIDPQHVETAQRHKAALASPCFPPRDWKAFSSDSLHKNCKEARALLH